MFIDVPMSKGPNSLVSLAKDTYPQALFLHEFATASVKATGVYPVLSVARTEAEDIEQDEEDESWVFDKPPIPDAEKEVVKILQKPSTKMKARVALKRQGRSQPLRECSA